MQIAILSAGEMGAFVGRELCAAGHTVSTVVAGRGAETVERAEEAGMQVLPGLVPLLQGAEMVLSILPPAVARSVAIDIASTARDAGRDFVFLECNAVSPAHVQTIAACFEKTGCCFVDGGIVGGPPRGDYRPHLYVSGDIPAGLGEALNPAFDVRSLGPDIGTASAMKMCYAAMTKGLNSLLAAALLAAGRYRLLDELAAELAESQPELLARAESFVPRLPSDAERWAPEMRFIAECFSAVNVTGQFHLGAAEILDLLAASEFGHETRRSRDRHRSACDTVRALI
ncbi:MAG: DUF1932 domain-containing protein [Pseudomonadota bacterium]